LDGQSKQIFKQLSAQSDILQYNEAELTLIKTYMIMSNPVQWLEIATVDLERAKSFYKKVLNLEFQLIEMPDTRMYAFGEPGQEGSAGALVQSPDNQPNLSGTIIYFSCKDVTTELGRVEAAAGTVIVPKTDIGDFGFFAHIQDTEGNRIGLHSNQ